MSAKAHRGFAQVQGNLTPMIDMIFLLIVFFVLVSRIVDRERVQMNLPQPFEAATIPAAQEQRIVINVLPGPAGVATGYRVGGADFDADRTGLAALTQYLIAAYGLNPHVSINIRADRATNYEHVEPVMEAVSTAARSTGAASGARVNLVVTQEP